jgi:hypothetical protein
MNACLAIVAVPLAAHTCVVLARDGHVACWGGIVF